MGSPNSKYRNCNVSHAPNYGRFGVLLTPQQRRTEFRKGLNEIYLPYYDALCSNLNANTWAPYFGLRTFAEQDKLYAQGRTSPGPIVTNAQSGQSPHEYGCATDWAYFSDGVLIWLSPSDPRWKEYIDAVTGSQLVPGAYFSHPDTDHNELPISDSWISVQKVFKENGLEAANAFIINSHQSFLGVKNE